MTELLYITDAYKRQFSAIVLDHIAGGIVLDRTAFYSGSGDEPCDYGIFCTPQQTWQVISVKTVNGIPIHFMEGELPPIGTTLDGEIDWMRRYNLMRTRTAIQILESVMWRDYGALAIASNFAPLEGRIDFDFELELQNKELLNKIEAMVNWEIITERPIETHFLSREQVTEMPPLTRNKTTLFLEDNSSLLRVVEIVGLDLQVDGRMYVQNTRQVGRVHIPKSKGQSNKRIYIELER